MAEEEEINSFIEDNKDVVKEIVIFWIFIKNLNKVAKWIVYIGAPLVVGLWSIRNWLKGQ